MPQLAPFLVAAATLALLFSVASLLAAAAIWKTRNAPLLDIEAMRRQFADQVADERAADRRLFVKALDEAAEISETVKRHRQRIDGAARGNANATEPAREMTPEEQRAEILRRSRLRRGA